MHPELRRYLGEGERAGLRYTLAIPRQAPIGLAGATLAQRAGSSLEFKDHRAYEPGDDLRHIDWSAYARSDQLSVKLFREEVTPHLDVVLDGSRSMDLEGTKKGGAAVALTAFFATAAARGGYGHAAWLLADGVRLVTAGRDRDLKLWHTVSGEPITTFSGHIRQVYAVAVSPDGQTIASGGFEGDVRLWRSR